MKSRHNLISEGFICQKFSLERFKAGKRAFAFEYGKTEFETELFTKDEHFIATGKMY